MISEHDELELLLDILKESGRWSRSEDDPSGVELEINMRIQRLTSVPTDRIVHQEPLQLSPVLPENKARKKRYAENHVRVRIPGGKFKWVHRDLAEKVDNGFGHWKWVLKETK